MHRWKNRDKVSSGGISAELNAVQRPTCSFNGKQVGKEDQQHNDDRMERSKCWSISISEFRLPRFQIPGVGDVKNSQNPEVLTLGFRSPEVAKCEIAI
jgi:hypothetical protein